MLQQLGPYRRRTDGKQNLKMGVEDALIRLTVDRKIVDDWFMAPETTRNTQPRARCHKDIGNVMGHLFVLAPVQAAVRQVQN